MTTPRNSAEIKVVNNNTYVVDKEGNDFTVQFEKGAKEVINLAKKLNQKFTAIDISTKALEVAEKNANLNKVEIEFKQLDILNQNLSEEYDVIISNPPYVDYNEPVGPETKFEPQNAIFANNKGLEFYEKIINMLTNQPKLIAFEIGMTQANEIIKFAQSKFPAADILVEKDLTGRDRYIFIERK